jgi:hypothetical protein
VYEAPVIMPHPADAMPMASVAPAAPVTPAALVPTPATPAQPEPAAVGTIVSAPLNMPEWAQTQPPAAPVAPAAPTASAYSPQSMPQSTVPVAPDVRPPAAPVAPTLTPPAAPAYTPPIAAAPVDLSHAFDAPTGPVGTQAPTAAPLRGTLDQPIPTFSTMPAAGSINVGLGGMPEQKSKRTSDSSTRARCA